jgi:glycosyltransferase involved in cell wall biosynthesis
MKQPLKFCMVTTFYPPYSFGGDAMYIYRLANQLATSGHQVDVVHCEDAYSVLSKRVPGEDFPNHENVKLYRLKSWAGALSPLGTQQTGTAVFKRAKLKAILENNSYDVIHYHNMSLIGITSLSYGSGVKLYTTHEHWLLCPMHVLWKYDSEVCTTKSCIKCTIHGGRPPQLWRYTSLMKRMLSHVDCFISPSRFTLQKHVDAGLDILIKHIPYFLPRPPQPWPEKHEADLPRENVERPSFLFVGRLEKIKGLQNLIPVFKGLSSFDLYVAGTGEYEPELKRLAEGSANIKFLGNLSQDQLRGLYKEAVAVIVPSICYETFGIIIIEAFSMKTPVIVNRLGALPEVVQDSGGGLIFENQDQLRSAIEMLANDRALRNDLGEKGFAAYNRFWNENAHLDQYLTLIENLKSSRIAKAERAPSFDAGQVALSSSSSQ